MTATPLPIFIHDQYLSRLTLCAGDGENKHRVLKGHLARALDEQSRSSNHWIPLSNRSQLFDVFVTHERVLLAVTSFAGIGKSIVLAQLEAMLPQVRNDLVTLRVKFEELPNDWEQYLRQNTPGHLEPFFVKKIHDELTACQASGASRQEIDKGELAAWIEAMIRVGSFVLIVDSLDEYNGNDASTKARELRTFLQHVCPNLHCVIGGRPHAITDTVWKPLFSKDPDETRRGRPAEAASEWDFYQVEMFDAEQTERFLGKELAEIVRQLQAEMEISPRSLEVLRTLDPQVIATLRSTADLYWHSTVKSLPLDNRERLDPKLVHTDLKIDEILHILSAIGITMALWHDDPRFPERVTSTNDEFGSGIPLALPDKSPDKTVDPGTMVIGQGPGSLDEFKRRLFARLCGIYPNWANTNPATHRPLVEHWWGELQRLNSQYVEFRFFEEREPGQIGWRNATVRDFFAALWMTTRATDEERSAFHQRIGIARDKQDASIAETWRMICNMPEEGNRPAIGTTNTEKNLPWLRMVNPLYASPAEETRYHGRPTELMYRAWPGLLYRAGFLATLAWSDEDFLFATICAQRFFDPKETNPANLQTRDEHAWTLVGGFLNQYLVLRDGGGEPAGIIAEDLKFCSCESYAGMVVRVGHSSVPDNPERDETLPRAFNMSAYQVTNRLYALFDPHHALRFSNYNQYSPEERCPAIYVTWYDAMMISIWCHGYLPSEWEWEYACRAQRRNAAGSNAIYYWGDDPSLFIEYAWVEQNSQEQTHPVGSYPGKTNPSNDFGLYDTLGNVIEWTRSRNTTKNSRRVVQRGGSFVFPAFLANCWYRERNDPWLSVVDFGFRVCKPW